MKRCFYFLSMFMLSLFVSCVEEFDDTEIWNEIDGLKSRVAALEEKVAENVSALQSMVSLGSIASYDYDAETGKGVITLVDGKKITIDQTVTGQTLMTVTKGDDGVWYWAICKDGVSTPLVVNGKNVPISITPALKISDENEWLISVDGGTTWVSTGIEYGGAPAGDESGDSGDSDATEVVFFKKAEKNGEYLILTLSDDTVIKVAIAGTSEFSAVSETLYFSRVSMRKSVELKMVNVSAYTITEVPEGWKANIEGEYLNVTSPEDFDKYPESGAVKALAVYENGLPAILSLEVAHEPMVSLKYMNEKVVVTLSEKTGEDFNGYVLTSWEKSSYSENEVVAWLNAHASELEMRTGTAEYELIDVLGTGFDPAKDYMIVAVPYLPLSQVSAGTMKYEVSDLQSITCKPSAGWKFTDVGFDRATLTAIVEDERYYAGFSKLEDWTNYGRENVLEAINRYHQLNPYTIQAYNGPANAFPDGNAAENINPGTDYLVWYLPVNDADIYTQDDFILYEFKTPDVSADASISAPTYAVKDITASGFTAEVTPATGAYKTYAAIKSSTAIQDWTTDADVVRGLINENKFSSGTAVNTVSTSSFSSEDEVYLLAVSVSEDGGYGTIVKKEVELKSLTFTDDLGVRVTGKESDLGNVTLTLEFTGSPSKITYFAETYCFYTDEVLEKMMALGQFGGATTKTVTSSSMTVELTGLEMGAGYTFYAVVSGADSKASHLYTYEFTPSVGVEYIKSTSADYDYGKPVLSGSWDDATTYTMNVEKPSTCSKYWLLKAAPDYFVGDVYIDSDKILAKQLYGVTEHTASETGLVYEYMNSSSRIYMVWLDDQGRYHAIYEYNPKAR